MGTEMDSRQAEEFFYGFKNHFMDFGLENMKDFMHALGNPQNQVRIIHVAGTNGKGSVSAFIASILKEAGYRVGRYNSPVVFEKRENITIDNISMSGEAFAEQVNRMRPAIEAAAARDRLPTIFEMETALSYVYFAARHCDFAVIECGLGGLKDATNVTESTVLSVFTSISMDHTAWLGDSLEKIAEAKAGIIKHSVPVLTIAQDNSVINVIRAKAEEKNALLTVVDKAAVLPAGTGLQRQRFRYRLSSGTEEEYEIQMTGAYQAENAAEAIEAAEILNRLGYRIEKEAVKKGLAETVMPGRFQLIKKGNPLIIIDGAHNPDAALRLRENIQSLLEGYNILFIMGIFADKDYRRIVKNTCDLADNIYVVRADGPRALEEEKLVKCIGELGRRAYSPANIRDALQIAVNNARGLTALNGKKSAVLCFGSLSWLKYVKAAVEEENY